MPRPISGSRPRGIEWILIARSSPDAGSKVLQLLEWAVFKLKI
jgi:hypothetical protein